MKILLEYTYLGDKYRLVHDPAYGFASDYFVQKWTPDPEGWDKEWNISGGHIPLNVLGPIFEDLDNQGLRWYDDEGDE
jgi:hypothetical protein